MYSNRLLIFLLCLLSFTQLPIQSQPITVNPLNAPVGMSEADYIASLLAGNGLVIETLAKTCDENAIGVFEAYPSHTRIANFGINNGIVMSSGNGCRCPWSFYWYYFW